MKIKAKHTFCSLAFCKHSFSHFMLMIALIFKKNDPIGHTFVIRNKSNFTSHQKFQIILPIKHCSIYKKVWLIIDCTKLSTELNLKKKISQATAYNSKTKQAIVMKPVMQGYYLVYFLSNSTCSGRESTIAFEYRWCPIIDSFHIIIWYNYIYIIIYVPCIR